MSTNKSINANISTFLLKQFADPTRITVNSLYNLSTITNGASITGSNSFSASALDLDLRAGDNFYFNLSDIGQNVFYGLTYTADSTIKNRNITLEIDLKSSYTNNFALLDTGNLAKWLSKPTIYNPIQNKLNLYPNHSSDIIISSFIGKYVVDLRYMNNILHVTNVYTYPYIYSNLRITQLALNSSIMLSQTLNPSSNPNSNTFVFAGTKFKMAWATNDMNIPIGVRFSGPDSKNPGNRIIAWSGPYLSGNLSESISIPSNLPYSLYDTFQLMVYPFTGLYSNQLEGNLQTNGLLGQIFDSRPLIPNIATIKPSLSTTIRIYNPGTINSFLDVGEIAIYSVDGRNITRPDSGVIITIKSSTTFQNDLGGWGQDNAFDRNPNTQFRGGFDVASGPDSNAYLEINLRPSTIQNEGLISSIVITGSPLTNLSLGGMNLLIHTTVSNSLSVSSIQTLTSEFIQTINFS
jgi:hypothetical protein